MNINTNIPPIIIGLILFISTLMLTGCDNFNNDSTDIENTITPQEISVHDDSASRDAELELENTRYLFVIADHSLSELQVLLNRAEFIMGNRSPDFEDIEIALVLHGPDINLFTHNNYKDNKPLVDLAAKLDAFDIIDMKICEVSMSSLGVSRSDVPAFIDSVPYGPAEIRRRTHVTNS